MRPKLAVSERALRDLERDIFSVAPVFDIFEAINLLPRVQALWGMEATAAYRLEPGHLGGYETELAHGSSLGQRSVLTSWLKTYCPGRLAYEPQHPEAWQRNVAHRRRDLAARGREIQSVDDRFFTPLGVGGRDQLRALLCEGPRLLYWFGGYRAHPFTNVERMRLTRLARVVSFRVRLEESFLGSQDPLHALVERFADPTFIVSKAGRIAELNRSAKALLAQYGVATMQSLVPCLPPCAIERNAVDGGELVIVRMTCARADASLRVDVVTNRYGLTRGQARVYRSLADGLSNAGIAATLGIGVRTVEAHVQVIFDKLGVSNRAAAVATLLDLH